MCACPDGGSNTGAIAGGIVGGIVGLLALVAMAICVCCYCKKKSGAKQAPPLTFDNNQGFNKPPAGAPMPYQKPPNAQYGAQPCMQPQAPVNYNGPGSQAGFAVQTNPATSTGALRFVHLSACSLASRVNRCLT